MCTYRYRYRYRYRYKYRYIYIYIYGVNPQLREFFVVLCTSQGVGAAADSKDYFDKTVLMHTSEGGHTGGVRVLLEACARVDCNDHPDSKTALMYAGVNGHESTLCVLLAAGDCGMGSQCSCCRWCLYVCM